METKQETKVTRDRVLQLNITGYYASLCSIPKTLKEYINKGVEETDEKTKYNAFGANRLILNLYAYAKHYNKVPKDEVKKNGTIISGPTLLEKAKILYPLITSNIEELKKNVSNIEISNKIKLENKKFDLNARLTTIAEYEKKNFYCIPFLLNGFPDKRILEQKEIETLAEEIGHLITFRELATPLEDDTCPMTIRDRYKLLMKYHKISDDNFKELSLRNRAPIYAKILNASPETLRKIFSDELQNKL